MKSITSRKNETALHIRKLGVSREYRRLCGEFVCDGFKLFEEARRFNAKINTVLTTGERDLSFPPGAQVYEAPRELIEYVSPMKNPQDIIFTCGIPENEGQRDLKGGVIILENVQDPGNVGTVIRTAGAFGIGEVLLTGSCADPYNPKTVRATMGAVFRQRVTETDMEGLKALKERGVRLYGAALSPECKSVCETDLKNCAVVIGSEGRGLTGKMKELCDGLVIIPMEPNCESLNAASAATVFMWEMRKAVR